MPLTVSNILYTYEEMWSIVPLTVSNILYTRMNELFDTNKINSIRTNILHSIFIRK